VIDANILIRAVLGKRTRAIIEGYAPLVDFLMTDVAVAEIKDHLPRLLVKRSLDPSEGTKVLEELLDLIEIAGPETYQLFRTAAELRIGARDLDDWPTLALALTLDCSIWTEDADFFGAGIATWTTDRVEVLLRAHASHGRH
jgi:predicted nucleic acid-binding protein